MLLFSLCLLSIWGDCTFYLNKDACIMSSFSNSWGLIGGVVATVGAFAAFLNFDFDSLVVASEDSTPLVTKDQVTEMLHELGQAVLREMMHTEQALQAQLKQFQGQVSQADVKKYLCAGFESTLSRLQTVVCEKRDIEESDFELAAEFYEGNGDESVVRAVKLIDDLYTRFGGPTPFSDAITPQVMADMLDRYTEASAPVCIYLSISIYLYIYLFYASFSFFFFLLFVYV